MLTGAALLASALIGCGEREEQLPPPAPPPPEKVEKVPKLPRGWTVLQDRAQGFGLGVPPGWRQGGDCLTRGASPGSTTIICSPDKLVTVSVFADRTEDALELSPDEFAVETLEGLAEEGFQDLKAGKPKKFEARYDGAKVTATGKASDTKVRQDVTVVVLRRDEVANFTAVIAANAEKPTQPAVKLAKKSLETLRSRPVEAGQGGNKEQGGRQQGGDKKRNSGGQSRSGRSG